MRDTSSWYGKIATELRDTGLLPEDITPKEFFSVELGLFFLDEHYPDEPIGALWPLLSGYVACTPGLEPVLRRLRILMGDTGRSNFFPLCLDKYQRAPERIRGFERTDDPVRRVTDTSAFRRQDVSLCRDRWDAYRDALAEPVPYAAVVTRDPAEPGHSYTFVRRDGRTETVTIPDIDAPPPPAPLVAAGSRVRQATRIDRDELRATAVWIDETLASTPGAPRDGNYTHRWDTKITDCVFEPGSAELVTKPPQILLDGVTHEVGLMNSGKSTKALILTVNRVHAGWHVTLVLESVMKTYEMVSLLRHLGINAVPLVGRSGRSHHAGTYWQSTLSTSPTTFPAAPDPAAAFVNSVCLLDPHRQVVDPDYAPLEPEDFPCRSRLRPAAEDRADKPADCPLISVCPHQLAERNIADAQVWVTTPQGLLRSKASPATENMRWLEACQHHTDLIIVDEADRVQKIFDDHFVQTELLVAADRGWADNTLIRSLQGLNRQDRLPMRHKEVRRFCRLGRELLEAVDELYSLLVSDEDAGHERLRATLDKNPFTGYSLLRRLTWALYGLPYGESVEAKQEQAAEDFFRDHLEDLALRPLDRPAEDLTAVTEAVIGRYRGSDDLDALDAWLLDNAPPDNQPAVKNDLGHLRLLFQSALWSSRITTLFLQMSNLYPAVADLLDLPDAESFWKDQPPADYQPLVPEALMGNLMALQWTRKRTGLTGDLRLMWVRGVGRWLIHHLHDLLEPEGIQGPHVLLTSATSWMRDSSLYNIDIRPTSVLREPEEDRVALRRSTMEYLPAHDAAGRPVFVSGRLGDDREEALRRVTAHLLRERPGQAPLLDQIRQGLDPNRQQVLFTTLSGDDAESSALYANRHTNYTARHVIPNDLQPGEYGLHLRQVHTFGELDIDVLTAAELAIQRGHNILNADRIAALGALFYLARPHPPASDLSFPLSLVNRDAMRALLAPVADPESVARAGRELRHVLRRHWHELLGEQVIFRRLRGHAHRAFVANAFASIYQTMGRTIRGGTTTQVYFCDAAFSPRNAERGATARDTVHTSLLVAIAAQLEEMLTDPAPDAPLTRQRDHVIDTTLYELAHHLFCSIRWPDNRRNP
ncbi:hypothetical protein Lesp02_02660 [Lentzea sp. NBRC 105346]|uniref:pPIWI_RE_Z domain-containing protein n=1 Tax=Lentzea sp. NBRC 105346 TaxID=3032205 RepID=UPI0024A5741B|nr:hypothetical protein [Lentzea sp. NBRC 105346]GLZ28076.1 hypothetical protein Lesp02_02660 [Lentzea sp. NBRC 105346]